MPRPVAVDQPSIRARPDLGPALLAALEAYGDGVVVLRAGRVEEASDGFERLAGRPAAELRALDAAVELAIPDQRARLAGLLAGLLAGGSADGPVRATLLRPDGDRVEVELTGRLLADAGPDVEVLLLVRDVTDTIHVERSLRDYSLLLDAQSQAALDGILVVSDAGQILYANRRFGDMWAIPAGVLATGDEAAALDALETQLLEPDAYRAQVAEIRAEPDAEQRDEVLLRDGRVFDRYTAPVRDEVGGHHGRVWFFRDVTPERRRRDEADFLADAGELMTGSLEYEMLAESLARVAVPTLADWCAVDVLGVDASYHRVGAAHVEPEREEVLRELDRRFPIRAAEGHLRGRVVATGEPVAHFEIDEATLGGIARDADHRAMLRELGMRSAIWLPLQARGRMLGVMSFGVGPDRRPYGPETLALARELARRAAFALDNARTYRQLRDREQQQAAVAELGRLAVAGTDLQRLFDEAVGRITATLRVEYAKVLRLEPGGHRVALVAGVGWQPGLVGTAVVSTGPESQAGYTLTSGEPVIVEDLRTETRFSGPKLLHDHGVVSGLSVIIEGNDGHWGVLGAHSTSRRQFDPDDVNFLQAVSNVLAEAIARRGQEEALQERDDRLEMTLAGSRTGIWDWDVRTGRLYWSPQIAALHGVSGDDVPESLDDYLALIHPDDRERFEHDVGRAVRDGTPYDLEFRIVWPDGSIHWTNGVGRVFYEDGQPVRMVGIGRDITDRKRAEEERDALLAAEREASALRDAFIGVVSHELRTPITTIYGGVKVLVRPGSAVAGETREAILRDVEAEADHLRRLVEDLLVLTRAERGRIEIEDEPVQLAHLARRVVATEAARWPGVVFELEAPASLPVVRGDETAIEQVMRNLLGNAAKYSPAGSTVVLELAPDGAGVRLAVLDEGQGFSSDEAERLFELFYRSPAAVRHASGAGIGLFVARRLIEAMGGRIWARPRRGRGSEFGFTLRRYEMDDEDA